MESLKALPTLSKRELEHMPMPTSNQTKVFGPSSYFFGCLIPVIGLIVAVITALVCDIIFAIPIIAVCMGILILGTAYYIVVKQYKQKRSILIISGVGTILILPMLFMAIYNNPTPRSGSGGSSMTSIAEQLISAQTAKTASSKIVDKLDMLGSHNEVLWTDYLIEVKSDEKYYYVVHREGSDTIPSYTRATTWPYSVVPIRDKRILRGILMNG
jgi:hypothetical protein